MPLDNDFWNNEAGELWNILVSVFVDTLMDGVQGGVDALPPDIAILLDFDVVNQAAIDYAKQYRYEWISGIVDTTRTQVQSLISDWILSGDPLPVLETQLEPLFGKIRAQMIASTEVTRIFAEANQRVWQSTGFISMMSYRTSVDDRVCPICSPLEDVEMPLNDNRAPPRHPRCRCWLQPIVNVDAVLAQTERILNA